MNSIKKILLTALIILAPVAARAAGIQVSPSRLEFKFTGNEPQTKEIAVANPTTDVQLFEISADNFGQFVKAEPSSFTLEAGTRKTVKIIVDAGQAGSLAQTGQALSTSLSVVSRPLADARLQVGTGVKLPLTVFFSAAGPKPDLTGLITYGIAALIIAGLAGIIWRVKKRNSRQKNSPD